MRLALWSTTMSTCSDASGWSPSKSNRLLLMQPVQIRGSCKQSPATLSLGSEDRTRCLFASPLDALLRSASM